MCKTSFKVVVSYDGTRSAKEVVNDAIASKVRRIIIYHLPQVINRYIIVLSQTITLTCTLAVKSYRKKKNN